MDKKRKKRVKKHVRRASEALATAAAGILVEAFGSVAGSFEALGRRARRSK